MALLIRVDGTEEKIEGDKEDGSFSLDRLQGLVGGYIQIVDCNPSITDGHSTFVCNEEGKLIGLPANKKATELSTYTIPDDVICGDVLFLKDGEIQ